MATYTPGGTDGTLNGTGEVTLVDPPASSVQRVVPEMGISVQNRDTAVVTVEIRKVSASGTRRIWRGDLDVGDTWYNDGRIVLDSTSDSVRAVMSAAATTTNPDWVSNWLDQSA